MIQAFLYSGVFLAVYALYCIQGFLIVAGIMRTPFAFSIVLYTLFPVGGFFNILVYTRPSVVTLHRRYSEYSWLRALWMVLKAGGEVPEERSLSEGVPITSQVLRDVDHDDTGCEDAIPMRCENVASSSFGSQEWFERRGPPSGLPRVQEDDIDEEE